MSWILTQTPDRVILAVDPATDLSKRTKAEHINDCLLIYQQLTQHLPHFNMSLSEILRIYKAAGGTNLTEDEVLDWAVWL